MTLRRSSILCYPHQGQERDGRRREWGLLRRARSRSRGPRSHSLRCTQGREGGLGSALQPKSTGSTSSFSVHSDLTRRTGLLLGPNPFTEKGGNIIRLLVVNRGLKQSAVSVIASPAGELTGLAGSRLRPLLGLEAQRTGGAGTSVPPPLSAGYTGQDPRGCLKPCEVPNPGYTCDTV